MPDTTLSGLGTLTVQTTTARESYPVAGALVTVDSDGSLGPAARLYTVRTDASGRTPVLTLPAPPRAGSLGPGRPAPFATYILRVEHPAYQTIEAVYIDVFEGVDATLPVYLLPVEREVTD